MKNKEKNSINLLLEEKFSGAMLKQSLDMVQTSKDCKQRQLILKRLKLLL